ncbi:formyltetrahydrofolate deformylase [Leifsonia sp. Root112D2]|jgi:formyltetrahydrofolate deformylase|uniref:formyltetrahydrofolate deformylase n=1 Tax=Leifsonia sp. Root112D2 TaxID=1736426 RepID=UPI0006F2B972|nr:formyltetrahydrofolate deformylase [Leifsonia sp. Root112D2]KQV06765.1 formyltetrahydrofolate deformylase [Leifsonia sp. Root112D2]
MPTSNPVKQSADSSSARADHIRLLVSGQDGPGIVAAVSTILRSFDANIVSLDQYSTDPSGGRFFQRTEFHLEDFSAVRLDLEKQLEESLGTQLGLSWKLSPADQPKRVAIFASKSDHCLLELLWRHRRGELQMNVVMVISNHPDLAEDVRQFGIPFIHVPVDRNDRSVAEQRHLELLQGNVDLVVLARYMQIITGDFLQRVGAPVINIHHSFLPSFIGAGPYQKAKDRGVKLIGATAHYVTEDLDEGPIIEQDVVRATHADTAADLTRRGADVERQVLARAVAWHCDDRVMRDGNSTVIF